MIQNREALLGPLSEAVRQAGRLFDDRAMAGQIRQKGPTDFVTSVDVSVQALLKARLAELAPEVQFMGEEQDNAGVDFRRPVWILDPVDGTTNLVHRFVEFFGKFYEGGGRKFEPFAIHTKYYKVKEDI